MFNLILHFTVFYNIDDYNKYFGVNEKLANDEVLVSKSGSLSKFNKIIINDKMYTIKKIDKVPPSNIIKDFTPIIFPKIEDMIKASEYLPYTVAGPTKEPNFFTIDRHLKLESKLSNDQISKVESLLTKNRIEVSTREKVEETVYILNGGLLFIGAIVGLSMLTGTVLMIYFKQISEGSDDKDKYEIMKKIGLDDSMIKKTMKSQLKWIFGLPAVTAIIHTLFASKILFQISSEFGITDKTIFTISLLIVLAVFIIIYGIVYLLTSVKYFRIINNQEAI